MNKSKHQILRLKSLKIIFQLLYIEITKKNKDENGVNVSVISPKRILVDGKTFDQIMYEDI